MLDLVAILPWYVMTISKAVSGGGGGSIQKLLGVVRIVRLTRILRVFKASKSLKMMIVLGKTMQRSSPVMAILLVSVTGMMLLFGAILLAIERGEYNKHTASTRCRTAAGRPSIRSALPCTGAWQRYNRRVWRPVPDATGADCGDGGGAVRHRDPLPADHCHRCNL